MGFQLSDRKCLRPELQQSWLQRQEDLGSNFVSAPYWMDEFGQVTHGLTLSSRELSLSIMCRKGANVTLVDGVSSSGSL